MYHTELAEIKKQVEHLIEMGFVRPRKRPWASSVLLLIKKYGSLRFYVDDRALNRFTVKNSDPPPRIDTLIDQIGSA